jgi:hypothetical protein
VRASYPVEQAPLIELPAQASCVTSRKETLRNDGVVRAERGIADDQV